MSTRGRKTRSGVPSDPAVREGPFDHKLMNSGQSTHATASGAASTSDPTKSSAMASLAGESFSSADQTQRGGADRDDARSCETADNKSQLELGAAVPGAENSRFRQRKPVQYMPVSRSTRSQKVPLAQKNELAYSADVPPLLTEDEKEADAVNAALHRQDILIDPIIGEAEMKAYLRRGLAKMVISRCDPPPVHVVSFGESSSDSSDSEGFDSEGNEQPSASGVADGAKRRRAGAARDSNKRARLTRSKAFLQEPPEPVCAENTGLLFIDGALVLFHPYIHGIFVDILKERGSDMDAALKALDALTADLVVIWTLAEQELFAAAHARFGDNMEHIYRELSGRFTNKTFKQMIDYFYRCVYAATEMKALLPDIQNRAMQRTTSQRVLATEDEEKTSSAVKDSEAASAPSREGRMSTRGKSTTPCWQRSDIYELQTSAHVFSDSDDDQVEAMECESKIRALQFIKRARVLLDPFSFSQLLNTLLLFDKKMLKPSELVIRVRNLCKVAADSALVVNPTALSVFHDFLRFFPAKIQKHLVHPTIASSSVEPVPGSAQPTTSNTVPGAAYTIPAIVPSVSMSL